MSKEDKYNIIEAKCLSWKQNPPSWCWGCHNIKVMSWRVIPLIESQGSIMVIRGLSYEMAHLLANRVNGIGITVAWMERSHTRDSLEFMRSIKLYNVDGLGLRW